MGLPWARRALSAVSSEARRPPSQTLPAGPGVGWERGPSSLVSRRTEPQSLRPLPPSHNVAVLLSCQAWPSPTVTTGRKALRTVKTEDSWARLFLSRFHHCLNKIKKMRILPRAKGPSPSEAPSVAKRTQIEDEHF